MPLSSNSQAKLDNYKTQFGQVIPGYRSFVDFTD